jgi:hypothetical protein
MADQGLLIVPRREVCLGIRPSAETDGKDFGALKVRKSLKKEGLAILLSRSGKYSLELPAGINRDTFPLRLYRCIIAFSCTFPLPI